MEKQDGGDEKKGSESADPEEPRGEKSEEKRPPSLAASMILLPETQAHEEEKALSLSAAVMTAIIVPRSHTPPPRSTSTPITCPGAPKGESRSRRKSLNQGPGSEVHGVLPLVLPLGPDVTLIANSRWEAITSEINGSTAFVCRHGGGGTDSCECAYRD